MRDLHKINFIHNGYMEIDMAEKKIYTEKAKNFPFSVKKSRTPATIQTNPHSTEEAL